MRHGRDGTDRAEVARLRLIRIELRRQRLSHRHPSPTISTRNPDPRGKCRGSSLNKMPLLFSPPVASPSAYARSSVLLNHAFPAAALSPFPASPRHLAYTQPKPFLKDAANRCCATVDYAITSATYEYDDRWTNWSTARPHCRSSNSASRNSIPPRPTPSPALSVRRLGRASAYRILDTHLLRIGQQFSFYVRLSHRLTKYRPARFTVKHHRPSCRTVPRYRSKHRHSRQGRCSSIAQPRCRRSQYGQLDEQAKQSA